MPPEPLRSIPLEDCNWRGSSRDKRENPWIHALWHEGKEGLGRIYVFADSPEQATAALPTLMRAALDPDWGERAVRLLAQMGPPAEPAIPLLIEIPGDPSRGRDRCQAASALQFIPMRRDVSLPALQRALKDPDPCVRTCAGHAVDWLNR